MFDELKHWMSQLFVACAALWGGLAAVPFLQSAEPALSVAPPVSAAVQSVPGHEKPAPPPIGSPRIKPQPPEWSAKPLPPTPEPEPLPPVPLDPPIVPKPPVGDCRYMESLTTAPLVCSCPYPVGDSIRACGPPPKFPPTYPTPY